MLVAPLCAQSSGFEEPTRSPDVRAIREGIRKSHERLLKIPGGIRIQYRLDVDQDKDDPVFIWREGLDGLLSIRWPEVRCRVEGPMSGYLAVDRTGNVRAETRPTVREACYNFETQAGVGRDDRALGQVTNFRHAFSAVMGFPLLFQFYAEMDQYFVPGKKFETEYMLADCLDAGSYELLGEEAVHGVVCKVLWRRGIDKIWISEDHGFMVCKREYTYGTGEPLRERTVNRELRQIAEGVWFPMHQTKEEFKNTAGNRLWARYDIAVRNLDVGHVSDSDVRITLTSDVQRIEDHISGIIYEPGRDLASEFDGSIRRELAFLGGGPHGSTTMMLLSAVLLLASVIWGVRGRAAIRDRGPPWVDRS